MKFWKAMHPPLPQQFSASKRTVGPELEVGIRVRDINYLLPQENGQLALTCTPKEVYHPIFCTSLILPGNQPWKTSAHNSNEFGGSQVLGKATLWSPNSSPGHLWGPSRGLVPRRENLRQSPACPPQKASVTVLGNFHFHPINQILMKHVLCLQHETRYYGKWSISQKCLLISAPNLGGYKTNTYFKRERNDVVRGSS